MRLVILESPYAGNIECNVAYARAAVRDCLTRGESPIASHLLFTQEGVLLDAVPSERALGIDAGLAWYSAAEAAVFYMDRGVSKGMIGARRFIASHLPSIGIEYRFLPAAYGWNPVHFPEAEWSAVREGNGGGYDAGKDLRVDLDRHSPTVAAPWRAIYQNRTAAYYPSMEAARAGAEALKQMFRFTGFSAGFLAGREPEGDRL